MTTFRQLGLGDTFDFIDDSHLRNSFFLRCMKTGPRSYQSISVVDSAGGPWTLNGTKYRVGSVGVKVHHVRAAHLDYLAAMCARTKGRTKARWQAAFDL